MNHKRIIDFTELRTVDGQDKTTNIGPEKNAIIELIIEEGLCGFFGVDKNLLLSNKEEEVPTKVI